jgi:hypothetical protein
MPDEPDDFSIPYMFLADGADAVGGKLYILGGGWDRLMVPELPGRSIKPFAIALGIRVPYSHTNRKFVLTIELVDADGAQVGDPLQLGGLEIGRPPGLTPGTAQNTPVGVGTNPEFPGPGRYSFVARIDGDIKNSASFEVMLLQQMPFVQPPAPSS